MFNHVSFAINRRIKLPEGTKHGSAHMLKPLEEAAEVFAAWQSWNEIKDQSLSIFYKQNELLDECVGVIQAVCNLMAALGVQDLTPYMQACEERNHKRGRL